MSYSLVINDLHTHLWAQLTHSTHAFYTVYMCCCGLIHVSLIRGKIYTHNQLYFHFNVVIMTMHNVCNTKTKQPVLSGSKLRWLVCGCVLQLERVNLSAAQTLRAAFIKVSKHAVILSLPDRQNPTLFGLIFFFFVYLICQKITFRPSEF